jgi:SSS family solute:Na+ symporter
MNIFIFFLYILVVFSLTYFFRIKKEKKLNTKTYLVSNRKLGMWEVAFSSSAAVFTSATIFFAFGLVTAFGMPGYGIMTIFLLTPLLLAFFAPYFHKIVVKKNILTFSDFFRVQYGGKTEKIFALISVLLTFSWIVASFNINITLLEKFLEIDKYIATIISFSIVIIYLIIGGFIAIVKTDQLQFIIMLLFSITISFFIKNPVPISETIDIPAWFSGIFWLFAPVFFWSNIASPSAWQPVIAAKNKKAARNGLLISVILGLCFYFPLMWLSFTFARDLPGVDHNLVLFEGIGNLFPDFLTPILFIGTYSAMISTLDTSLFYTASNTINNLLPRNFTKKIKKVKLIKISIIFFSITAIIGSFYIQGFVEFILAITPIIGITAFPFFIAMFIKLPDKATCLAIILGLICFIYLFFFPPQNFLWNTLPALVTGFIMILLIIYKLTKKNNIKNNGFKKSF